MLEEPVLEEPLPLQPASSGEPHWIFPTIAVLGAVELLYLAAFIYRRLSARPFRPDAAGS